MAAGVIPVSSPSDRVLVVDNDAELCTVVSEYLACFGFAVDHTDNARTGLKRAKTGSYGTVLLELKLSGLDIFAILAELRRLSQVDILLLTGRAEDADRILSLEMGADDFLTKPFSPRELLARIHAVQRRTHRCRPDECFLVNDVQIDPGSRSASYHGHALELTTMEFSLLETLMKSAGHVVTREVLLDSVLGRHLNPFDRSLDMLVSRLRRKLDATGATGRIKTIRLIGYQFATSTQLI